MQLHDIFPEVPNVEYSFYIFLAINLVGFALLYFLYKVLKNRQNKLHPLDILKHYNPDDAKQTAYQISYYGKQLATNETQKQHLSQLEEKLDSYKYLKTSQSLSKEEQEEIEKFIHTIKGKNV